MVLMTFLMSRAWAVGDGISESVTWAQIDWDGGVCDSTLGAPADLIYASSMTDYWFDEVATWSFTTNNRLLNGSVEGEDLGDVTNVAWGTDTQTTDGIDLYDIAYVVSHGGQDCATSTTGGWSFVGAVDSATTPLSSTCAPVIQDDTQFGDTDLNQYFTGACNSVQTCVWDDNHYDALNAEDFHLYAGFHGINTDGPFIGSAVASYVGGARTVDVGSDWVAAFTNVRVLANDDDCAVVIVYADNSTQANSYFNNAGLDDYYSVSTGSQSSQFRFFTSGCDPEDGFAL
jgi:hypothetical protein